MPPSRCAALLAALGLALPLLAACGGSGGASGGSGPAGGSAGRTPSAAAASCTPDITAVDGRPLYGVNLDWAHDSAAGYATRLGRTPAVYVSFAAYPLQGADLAAVDAAVTQVAALHAALMLTLEPNAGLQSVTPQSAADLATLLAGYNARGVPVLVRFAHEMNGSWYAWGQQPAAYKAAFRTVAGAVHAKAKQSLMLWAPNYGGGYPFAGGAHGAPPGTPERAALDTDHDGRLSQADDPYGPYYPGDDAVDWVGMSLYHWGTAYPWGENEVPEAGKLVAMLTGSYRGAGGDERSVPDFYSTYGRTHGKPVALTETAALYAPGRGGAPEGRIKSSWWKQVLDPELPARFPRLALVSWFEWDKQESEIHGRVDWGVTRTPALLAGYRAALPSAFRYAGC